MIWPFKRSETRAAPDPSWENMRALVPSGPINSTTAQGVAAVYACVAAISGDRGDPAPSPVSGC